ncbi:MAG: CoA transferase, partial [Gaiellales bacterium]
SGTAPSRAMLLLEAIGGQELVDDPRFRTTADRQRNADDLDALVAVFVGERTAERVEQELGSRGVALSRVYTVAETLDDEHYVARGTLAAAPDPALGSVTMQAPVPRMSRTPGSVRHAGPALGSSTAGVLRELGFSDDEVEAGARDGAWALSPD